MEKTEKKYDNCVRHHHDSTRINTFFYLAKEAGIDLAKKKTQLSRPAEKKENEDPELLEKEDHSFHTPLLPASIYSNLPPWLAQACSLFHPGIERDIFLMSALTVISGCLPNIEGVYFNRSLSAHLYLFITGPSASGKGTMIWARYLAQAIHEDMYKSSLEAKAQYLKDLEVYENLPKNQRAGLLKPEEPARKMFFIPANSSSSAMTQLLAENDFRGIIFESEADTLSNTAKQDWGDSSDIFRKAFHHENTTMARRTNRETIEITNPHLAICISGTPGQVKKLMPDVENGLFSRFMYYAFQDTRGFLNPFVSHQDLNYHQFFIQKSYEVFHLHEKLKKLPCPLTFKLSEEQANNFTTYFQSLLDKNKMLLSQDLDANTKRLGVIAFRLAMVLTSLRMMDKEIGSAFESEILCPEQDFKTAMEITTTLESHAVAVYQHMPKITMSGSRLTFYEKLPLKFNRQDYLSIAKDLGIEQPTADKYIRLFKTKLLDHQYNEYLKN